MVETTARALAALTGAVRSGAPYPQHLGSSDHLLRPPRTREPDGGVIATQPAARGSARSSRPSDGSRRAWMPSSTGCLPPRCDGRTVRRSGASCPPSPGRSAPNISSPAKRSHPSNPALVLVLAGMNARRLGNLLRRGEGDSDRRLRRSRARHGGGRGVVGGAAGALTSVMVNFSETDEHRRSHATCR